MRVPPAPGTSDAGDSADSGSGGWSTVAVFLPDGTAQQDADIRLQTPESGPAVIHLRALTGEVSTRWISANQKP